MSPTQIKRTKRQAKIIRDSKRRGEWAESVFMARAAENGLPVSKPLGDSDTFDCVVGRPGKFVGVQVKCTMAKMKDSQGYVCSVKSNNKGYRAGAFDFLAAYVIPEDAWYIVPAKVIRGLQAICLGSARGNYEQYLEAWHLLREAAACEEEEPEPESEDGPAASRLRGAFDFMRKQLQIK